MIRLCEWWNRSRCVLGMNGSRFDYVEKLHDGEGTSTYFTTRRLRNYVLLIISELDCCLVEVYY